MYSSFPLMDTETLNQCDLEKKVRSQSNQISQETSPPLRRWTATCQLSLVRIKDQVSAKQDLQPDLMAILTTFKCAGFDICL